MPIGDSLRDSLRSEYSDAFSDLSQSDRSVRSIRSVRGINFDKMSRRMSGGGDALASMAARVEGSGGNGNDRDLEGVASHWPGSAGSSLAGRDGAGAGGERAPTPSARGLHADDDSMVSSHLPADDTDESDTDDSSVEVAALTRNAAADVENARAMAMAMQPQPQIIHVEGPRGPSGPLPRTNREWCAVLFALLCVLAIAVGTSVGIGFYFVGARNNSATGTGGVGGTQDGGRSGPPGPGGDAGQPGPSPSGPGGADPQLEVPADLASAITYHVIMEEISDISSFTTVEGGKGGVDNRSPQERARDFLVFDDVLPVALEDDVQVGGGPGGGGQVGSGFAGDGQVGNGYPNDGYADGGYANNGYANGGYANDGYVGNGQVGDAYASNGQGNNGYASNGQGNNGYANGGYAGNEYAQGYVQGYAEAEGTDDVLATYGGDVQMARQGGLAPSPGDFERKDHIAGGTRPYLRTDTPAYRVAQRYSAAVLYYSLGGPGWNSGRYWLEPGVHECDFVGIVCEDVVIPAVTLAEALASDGLPDDVRGVVERVVVAVDLPENGLRGEIPREIAGLPMLGRLNLWSNEISGTIPSQIGTLNNLSTVKLDDNLLTGYVPSDLGRLSSVRDLSLSLNPGIQGRIPAELGDMSSLESLDLGGMGLRGAVPTALGRLENLTRLYLQNNRLGGTLPDEYGVLSGLEELVLSGNGFVGGVPASWSGLRNLRRLELQFNDLEANLDREGFCSMMRTGRDGRFGRDKVGGQYVAGGQLDVLVADCGAGGRVRCDCCTRCAGLD